MADNRYGWWGILLLGSLASVTGTVITSIVCWFVVNLDAFSSALLAGGIVWMLSALTVLVIALVWHRARHAAIPLTMAAFVLKLIVFGVLLTLVPAPDWLQTVPAAISAVVSIVLWQTGEVLAFARTRHQLYNV